PICCLEGEEGHGKSWLAAKCMRTICQNENVVTFWLDSEQWSNCESIFDLLHTCFSSIYLSYDERKIAKLQNKPAKTWRKTLIVLDGVNESNAIETAQRILTEYFKPKSDWKDRIRFLLTTRPLDDYPDFKSYLWDRVHTISIDPFNDSELQNALSRTGLQLDDLPNSLKDIARIPRYLQRCVELRDELGSFDVVTKEMVLWADLLYKIKYAGDPQIRKKLDWQRIEEAQDDLAKLAKEAKWTNINDAPQASVELLTDCFSDYHEIRRDLEEQRITLTAHKREAKLSKDHIVLGWALYLANLFECEEFTEIKDFAECFQSVLEPIPSEDLRTQALFVALQITAISPNPDIPQDQLSQKRAALMLGWLNSHNAQITSKHISFWVQTDTDAYAQVVKVQLETHNQPNYEEALIRPLAHVWLHQTGQIDQLKLRLTKWLLAISLSDGSEEIIYVGHKGNQFPRRKNDIQIQLSSAVISILSQRPDPQFLEPFARCYGSLRINAKSDQDRIALSRFSEKIGKLMRWDYTESVLDELCVLAEQPESDTLLLEGIYGLANCLRVDLPPILERPLTEEDIERRTFVEQHNRRFKPYINRIRNQERLLIGDSPATNGNYHGLDYLAVRTDLPDLHHEDHVEIKKILQDVSVNAKLGWGVGATLEDFCIENLLPWVAKDDPESYAELACSLKLNTLNQKWAQFKLSSIQGLIFQPEDCEKIT
ncbi:MAG: NACHT domain-containing protein, partial [Candidatus Poribacteria bacterium]|nr:NACHT domain-containing protein [Candidatus Poribacteria bacterium]